MTDLQASGMRPSWAWLHGPWPFVVLLLVNLALPFTTVLYPTLDGPAHLYNARLLQAWLAGDPTVHGFYTINGPVPNWTDHVVLTGLLYVLPARLAEKALIMGYLLLLTLGFRRLVRTLAPGNEGLSLLVFPLLFTHLFQQGFFNFSIGLGCWCLLLAYGLEHPARQDVRRWALLCFLATATYFSNALVFGLAALMLGWAATLQAWTAPGLPVERWRRWARTAVFLTTAFLPGILCLAWFNAQVIFQEPYRLHSTKDLLLWLIRPRTMLLERNDLEAPYAWIFGGILLVLTIFRVLQGRAAGRGNVLGLPLLFVFVLYLAVPDGAQAGMMNDRFVIITLLLWCMWLATTLLPRTPALLLALVAGYSHLGLLRVQAEHTRDPLDALALGLQHAARSIPDGAVVDPIRLHDHYLSWNASNYMGVDRPLIILDNYEAQLGWFPLRWRADRPQYQCLPGEPCRNKNDTTISTALWPPYVVVFGDPTRLEQEAHAPLRAHLSQHYQEVAEGSSTAVRLFRLRSITPAP